MNRAKHSNCGRNVVTLFVLVIAVHVITLHTVLRKRKLRNTKSFVQTLKHAIQTRPCSSVVYLTAFNTIYVI